MKQLFTNNASADLASTLTIGGGSMTVVAGQGARFAAPAWGEYQVLTLDNGTHREIVRLTSRSTDVLTIQRAQEGTTAREWPAGSKVESRITAGSLTGVMRNASVDPYGLALGNDSTATGSLCVAVGINAIAEGSDAVALGRNAYARDGGVSLGPANAYTEGVAAGIDAKVYAPRTWNLGGLSCIPRDDWNYGTDELQKMTGQETICASSWVDLGNVPLWAASTTYTDGDVVRPTTGGTKQMHLWIDNFPTRKTVSSGATQPTWDTSNYGSTQNTGSDDYWITTDPAGAGYLLGVNPGVRFFIREIGFICFKYANVTAAPYMSAGTAATEGLYVNNQQLSGITGAGQMQAFAAASNIALTNANGPLVLKLKTAATGTNSQFHGRWFVRGFAINSQNLG